MAGCLLQPKERLPDVAGVPAAFQVEAIKELRDGGVGVPAARIGGVLLEDPYPGSVWGYRVWPESRFLHGSRQDSDCLLRRVAAAMRLINDRGSDFPRP